MHSHPDLPRRIGLRGKILAILLLLGSIVSLLAGLSLVVGDPYHDKRLPFLLLFCLVFLVWGLGFGYVASRMLITQRANPVSGMTIGLILVTPYFIYFALLVTKGELLDGILGIVVLTIGCIFYVYNNRPGTRSE